MACRTVSSWPKSGWAQTYHVKCARRSRSPTSSGGFSSSPSYCSCFLSRNRMLAMMGIQKTRQGVEQTGTMPEGSIYRLLVMTPASQTIRQACRAPFVIGAHSARVVQLGTSQVFAHLMGTPSSCSVLKFRQSGTHAFGSVHGAQNFLGEHHA